MISIQFESGEQFTWREKEYTIQKMLGSGMTANVYLAEMGDGQQVAIKVLKPGVSKDIHDIFIKEPENLGRVKSAWMEAYPHDPLIIPEFYGAEINTDTPFIVMEVINGTKLADQSEELLGLGEEKAYWIGLQIGKLLTLLHEKTGRCYSDIKLDNFWLVEDPNDMEKPRLKITDWSILADLDEDGVQRDLFFASLIMNHTLTGSMPEYARNQLSTALEDASKFTELCSKTRVFLNRALSRNIARRYQTSRDWFNEVKTLQQMWSATGTSLLNAAVDAWDQMQQSLVENQHEEAAKYYDRARACLEIAGDKGEFSDVWEDYWERVKKHEAEQSYLGRGKTSLLGSALEKAIEYFMEGADLYPSQAEDLWRWAWLSKGAFAIGVDDFRPVRGDAINAIEDLLNGNPNAAYNGFVRIFNVLQDEGIAVPKGLQYLANEAQILNLCNDAADLRNISKYDDAIRKIEQAAELYGKLPNDPPLHWVDAYGDINKLLDEVTKERQTLGMSNDLVMSAKQSLENGDFVAAASDFRIAYSKAPESRDVIQTWKESIKQCLAAGDHKSAFLLAQKAYGTGAIDELRDLFTLSLDLIGLEEKAAAPEEKHFHDAYEDYIQKFGDHEFGKGMSLNKIMRFAFEAAQNSRQHNLANDLAHDIGVIWPAQSDELQRQITLVRQLDIEALQKTSVNILQSAVVMRMSEDREARLAAYHTLKQLSHLLDSLEGQFDQSGPIGVIKHDVKQTEEYLGAALCAYENTMTFTQEAREQRLEVIKQEIPRLCDPEYSSIPSPMEHRLARAMAFLAEWETLSNETDTALSQMKEDVFRAVAKNGSLVWKQVIAEAQQLLMGGFLFSAVFMLNDLDMISNHKLGSLDPAFQELKKQIENILKYLADFKKSEQDTVKRHQ